VQSGVRTFRPELCYDAPRSSWRLSVVEYPPERISLGAGVSANATALAETIKEETAAAVPFACGELSSNFEPAHGVIEILMGSSLL
jgi:hypothetical protein